MENIIERILKYNNVEIIGGETAVVIRDIEAKDYVVVIPNKFNNVNIDIMVVEKLKYTEVSIHDIQISNSEIRFRLSDSNILMSSFIWVKENSVNNSPAIRNSNNEVNESLLKEIEELREENKTLTTKYDQLVSKMEERFKSIEKSVYDIRNRNNNQKRNDNNNIPRVDIKTKQKEN